MNKYDAQQLVDRWKAVYNPKTYRDHTPITDEYCIAGIILKELTHEPVVRFPYIDHTVNTLQHEYGFTTACRRKVEIIVSLLIKSNDAGDFDTAWTLAVELLVLVSEWRNYARS